MPVVIGPIIARRRRSNTTSSNLLTALVLFVGGVAIAVASRHLLDGTTWLARSVLYHADAFGFGAALQIASRSWTRSPERKTTAATMTAVASVGLIAVLVSMTSLRQTWAIDEVHPERLLLFTATSAVIVAARAAERRHAGLFDFPLLRTIGQLSFVIYLFHIPAMHAATWLAV